MAKKTIIKIVDDLDGVELDEYETVRWSLGGTSYEFDTSPEHAEQFRDHMASYVAASRTVSREGQSRRPSTVRGNPAGTVRQWARDNGYAISGHGRIPTHIVESFDAAH